MLNRVAPLYDRVRNVIPDLEWPLHAAHVAAIEDLKKSRKAVILAHNYQTPEIYHCVADIRGDSLALAQKAVRQQADLVRKGVVLEDGSGIQYTFTGLNAIKPEMVAEATRDARNAAEQFAEDSGAGVGAIRHATQGYFSISARDGEAGGWGIGDTPHKKVRVVTTVDFSLE